MFDSFFSGLTWIDKLHDCNERMCFPYNVCYVNWKNSCFQSSWQLLLIGKMLYQKRESHAHVHRKIRMKKQGLGDKKATTSKMSRGTQS